MTLTLHPAIEGVTFGISMPKVLASKFGTSSSSSSSSADDESSSSQESSSAETEGGSAPQDRLLLDSSSDSSNDDGNGEDNYAAVAADVASKLDPDVRIELLSNLASELRKERRRRTELEERVANQLLLGADASQREDDAATRTRTTNGDDDARELRRQLTALEAERDELRHAIEAVTTRGGGGANDAVRYASKPQNEGRTLPPDTVRLLEVAPWDEGVERHASAVEEVYEWEMFDGETGTWTGRYQSFPDDFRSVPVVKPQTASSSPPGWLDEHTHFWTKKGQGKADCVLTDEGCTRVLDVSDGYPLPSGGTWEWIGEWTVDRRRKRKGFDNSSVLLPSPLKTPPVDGEGWSYASQPKLLVSSWTRDRCRSTAGTLTDNRIVERKFRRRRWTRRRVLTSYPSISEMPEHFLALKAENARLRQGTSILEDKVAELERRLEREREEAVGRRLRQLTADEMMAKTARQDEEEEKAQEKGVSPPVREDVKVAAGEEGGSNNADASPARPKKRLVSSLPVLGKYIPSSGAKGHDEGGKSDRPATKVSSDAAASSLILSEVKASAWKAMGKGMHRSGSGNVTLFDKLSKISESSHNSASDPARVSDSSLGAEEGDAAGKVATPGVGIALVRIGVPSSFRKLVNGDDCSAAGMDDTVTEPTAGSCSAIGEEEEEEDDADTLSLASEATRSEASVAARGQGNKSAATGRGATTALGSVAGGGGGRRGESSTVLQRFMSKPSSLKSAGRSATTGSAGTGILDLDETIIQVGKEIYITNKKVVGKEERRMAVQQSVAKPPVRQPPPVQLSPFSTPTIRF